MVEEGQRLRALFIFSLSPGVLEDLEAPQDTDQKPLPRLKEDGLQSFCSFFAMGTANIGLTEPSGRSDKRTPTKPLVYAPAPIIITLTDTSHGKINSNSEGAVVGWMVPPKR